MIHFFAWQRLNHWKHASTCPPSTAFASLTPFAKMVNTAKPRFHKMWTDGVLLARGADVSGLLSVARSEGGMV